MPGRVPAKDESIANRIGGWLGAGRVMPVLLAVSVTAALTWVSGDVLARRAYDQELNRGAQAAAKRIASLLETHPTHQAVVLQDKLLAFVDGNWGQVATALYDESGAVVLEVGWRPVASEAAGIAQLQRMNISVESNAAGVGPRVILASGVAREVHGVSVFFSRQQFAESSKEDRVGATATIAFWWAIGLMVGVVALRRTWVLEGRILTALRRAVGRRDSGKSASDDFQDTVAGSLAEVEALVDAIPSAVQAARDQAQNAARARELELEADLARVQQDYEDARRYAGDVNRQVEAERRRVSREIHDEFNAAIVVMRGKLDQLQQKFRALQGVDAQQMLAFKSDLVAIEGAIGEIYATARRLTKELRPEVIDTMGVAVAIGELVRTLRAAYPECLLSFDEQTDLGEIHGNIAIAVYRAVQEALTNVYKHSGASVAQVLARKQSADWIEILIEDNGTGFSPDATRGRTTGVGLIGIRERMREIGGDAVIESSAEGGTRVTLRLPTRSTFEDSVGSNA